MTKKDYELIAGELKNVKRFVDRIYDLTDDYNSGKYDAWYIAVCGFCTALQDKNPKFDRNKFLNSCGIEVDMCDICGDNPAMDTETVCSKCFLND